MSHPMLIRPPKSPSLFPQAFTNAALLSHIRILQAKERTPGEDYGLERMLEEWRYRFDLAWKAELGKGINTIIAR